MEKDLSTVEHDYLNLVCNYLLLTTPMSLCLSEKCKDNG